MGYPVYPSKQEKVDTIQCLKGKFVTILFKKRKEKNPKPYLPLLLVFENKRGKLWRKSQWRGHRGGEGSAAPPDSRFGACNSLLGDEQLHSSKLISYILTCLRLIYWIGLFWWQRRPDRDAPQLCFIDTSYSKNRAPLPPLAEEALHLCA